MTARIRVWFGRTFDDVELTRWDPVRGTHFCAIDRAVAERYGRRATWTPDQDGARVISRRSTLITIHVWVPVSLRYGGGVEHAGEYVVKVVDKGGS